MIGNGVLANEESLSKNGEFVFNELVISNLQMQLEKVTAEAGMDVDGVNENSDVGKGGGTSIKKVRFQMNRNLVWKPHSPLPPQSVRIPPSATPRGSALKKGVPAGPVREMPRKAKLRFGSAKKARKSPRLIIPAIKRLKKLRPSTGSSSGWRKVRSRHFAQWLTMSFSLIQHWSLLFVEKKVEDELLLKDHELIVVKASHECTIVRTAKLKACIEKSKVEFEEEKKQLEHKH
ncbi:hypothetical protein GIB67_004862, partial [Kingdonia uniflora]